MKKIMTMGFVFAVFLLDVRSDVTLPDLFSDHMVLQAEAEVPVWGQADPGTEVTVEFAGQKKETVADASGKWQVYLDPMPASATPCKLVVRSSIGNQPSEIDNVLVGEVWLCSGQSNMAFGVGGQEKPAAADFPEIRFFTEQSSGAVNPSEKCRGQWVVCSPENFKTFSGTAYFFGKNLHTSLQRPVGLIVSAVGGTPIESWMSRESLRTFPELTAALEQLEDKAKGYNPASAQATYEKRMAEFDALVERLTAEGQPLPKPKQRPNLQEDPRATALGNLFNGKIAPLVPYAIRGVVWYQGESNASTPESGRFYSRLFPALIRDWRTRWGSAELPFIWVQLPKYENAQFKGWREVRESQLKTLSLPGTGMAITSDTGDASVIHPNNKAEVGRRLCLLALAKVYGRNGACSGPLPAGHQIKGSEIICAFEYAVGLKTSEGGLRGFEIAGEDRKWVPANARIEGASVIVSSPDVPHPVAVRYAWQNVSDANLVNGDDLPASPFRTDDF